MTVRSLFFATYRDMAGSEELVLDLPASATVEDLVRELRSTHAGLASLPPKPVVAVNMTYAPLSTPLSEGDEVAFIPPVAGG